MWLCSECGADARVTGADPVLGEAGAFDLVCTRCAWEAFVPAESTARTRIGALREIVRTHSARRVEGFLVDAVTASMLVQVFKALSPESREKFGKPSLARLVDFGWRAVR